MLKGIKDITGSKNPDPLFDWSSDKEKNVQKHQMPSIDSVTGPGENEDILFP